MKHVRAMFFHIHLVCSYIFQLCVCVHEGAGGMIVTLNPELCDYIRFPQSHCWHFTLRSHTQWVSSY